MGIDIAKLNTALDLFRSGYTIVPTEKGLERSVWQGILEFFGFRDRSENLRAIAVKLIEMKGSPLGETAQKINEVLKSREIWPLAKDSLQRDDQLYYELAIGFELNRLDGASDFKKKEIANALLDLKINILEKKLDLSLIDNTLKDPRLAFQLTEVRRERKDRDYFETSINSLASQLDDPHADFKKIAQILIHYKKELKTKDFELDCLDELLNDGRLIKYVLEELQDTWNDDLYAYLRTNCVKKINHLKDNQLFFFKKIIIGEQPDLIKEFVDSNDKIDWNEWVDVTSDTRLILCVYSKLNLEKRKELVDVVVREVQISDILQGYLEKEPDTELKRKIFLKMLILHVNGDPLKLREILLSLKRQGYFIVAQQLIEKIGDKFKQPWMIAQLQVINYYNKNGTSRGFISASDYLDEYDLDYIQNNSDFKILAQRLLRQQKGVVAPAVELFETVIASSSSVAIRSLSAVYKESKTWAYTVATSSIGLGLFYTADNDLIPSTVRKMIGGLVATVATETVGLISRYNYQALKISLTHNKEMTQDGFEKVAIQFIANLCRNETSSYPDLCHNFHGESQTEVINTTRWLAVKERDAYNLMCNFLMISAGIGLVYSVSKGYLFTSFNKDSYIQGVKERIKSL